MTEMVLTHEQKAIISSKKLLLWLGIVSILMIFAAFTSAYIVRQAEGNWVVFEMPQMFFISTALILISSSTMFYAAAGAKKNNSKQIATGLKLTLLLGLGFAIAQFLGWQALVDQGVFLVGNPSGSFFYVISGVHLAHVIGGIIVLLFTLRTNAKGLYTADNRTGLQLCSIYWHFLGVLWVYLFLFLWLVR